MKRVRVFLLLGLWALTLTEAWSAEMPERRVVLPAEKGIYHSAHPDYGLQDNEVTEEKIQDFIGRACKKIVWSYVSDHWDKGIQFPVEACTVLNGQGIIPLIGIMPWSTLEQSRPEPVYTLHNILSGCFDRDIRKYARDAAALPFPLMIEFGPEANGSWFPWSAAWNGGGTKNRYGDWQLPDGPERFRDAYRHIVTLFREEGVSNVTWVFHVASRSWPDQEWNSLKYYYPGDSWVDWVGVSVYGRLRQGETRSFVSMMDSVYPQLVSLSPVKPLALLEIGISEDSQKMDKASWITEAFEALYSGRYPRVRAVSWWNKMFRPDGTRSFLEIDSSEESLKAYRHAVTGLLDEAEI